MNKTPVTFDRNAVMVASLLAVVAVVLVVIGVRAYLLAFDGTDAFIGCLVGVLVGGLVSAGCALLVEDVRRKARAGPVPLADYRLTTDDLLNAYRPAAELDRGVADGHGPADDRADGDFVS